MALADGRYPDTSPATKAESPASNWRNAIRTRVHSADPHQPCGDKVQMFLPVCHLRQEASGRVQRAHVCLRST